MPYRLQWYDAPSDFSIKVLLRDKDNPPKGYHTTPYLSRGYPEATIDPAVIEKAEDLDHRVLMYYHCPHCEGWIAGEPNQYHENTLVAGQLGGRSGDVYYCRRCGHEIGFVGMVS